MFWTITTPRWRRSEISLSSSACRISSQWVVWERKGKQWGVYVSKEKKNQKNPNIFLYMCLLFQGCDCRAPVAQPSAWPEFLQQLCATARPPLRSRARPAWGDRFLLPGTSSEPGNTLLSHPIFQTCIFFRMFLNWWMFVYLCAQHQITHALSGRGSDQVVLLKHVAFNFRDRLLLYDLLPVLTKLVKLGCKWVQKKIKILKKYEKILVKRSGIHSFLLM